jgi:hypothetical protein
MRIFREKLKEWALGLALFAMLLQALIPAAQALPLDRDGDSGFDALIICTAWGIKVLQLTTGEEAPVKQTSAVECPVCSVQTLKLSLPGVDVPAPLPSFRAGRPVRPVVGYVPPEQDHVTHSHIRAPPLA